MMVNIASFWFSSVFVENAKTSVRTKTSMFGVMKNIF